MDSVWQTVGILSTGIVVVIGGILLLRMHAFLALILGAFVVAALTPRSVVERFHIEKEAITCQQVEHLQGPDLWRISGPAQKKKTKLKADTRYVVFLSDGSKTIGRVVSLPQSRQTGDGRSLLFRFLPAESENGSGSVPLSAGQLLVEPHVADAARKQSSESFAARVASGFGNTAASIGILIAMASIIGKCLLDSGAADRIVRTSLRIVGERLAPAAFVSTGFLLGIPVFFDTVFYLMIPLGKAMQVRTGRNYLLYVLSIVCGATMAHSLVPPTPGPLIAAEQLGVELGTMIFAGCLVGVVAAASGFGFAWLLNRRFVLPLRESADCSMSELASLARRPDSELPPFWLAIVPILLPVFLIGGITVLESLKIALPATVDGVVRTVGEKNVAVTLAALVSMLTLIWKRRISRRELTEAVSQSLTSGGSVILITSAGGAFGVVLQQTGIASLIHSLPTGSPVLLISMAWLVTLAIRAAQGSATVAMVTAGGLLSGIAMSGELGFHPVYLALAIGCGSKPATWMNDSGFWVITKMSGMTEGEGLKYVCTMNSFMGVVGLLVTIAGAILFPLAGG